MKRLLIFVLLVAPVAAADVVITNTYTDAQAARITRAMERTNGATCHAFGLPANCTTVQVRTEFCKRANLSGSDCAGATQFIIYRDVTQFDKRVLLEKITEWQAQDAAYEKAAAAAAFAAKSPAEQNAVCASLGLSAGCTPF